MSANVNLSPAVVALSDAASNADWRVHEQETSQKIPALTCPDIDKIIREIRSAIKAADFIQRNTECSSAKDSASEIEWDLLGIEDELEKLRASNDTLRDLGKAWHRIADELRDTLRVCADAVVAEQEATA